jgi:hypothetical protein
MSFVAGGAMTELNVGGWLAALERTHLADLTTAEVARALRALSSCYVERRSKLPEGAALASAGKRAAFALLYGPLHFFVVSEIVRALPRANDVLTIVDLGCGTGAAGAAWAIASGARQVSGFDRHPWAVAEANAAYRQLGLHGRAAQKDMTKVSLRTTPGSGVIAAYAINELTPASRNSMRGALLRAHADGGSVLVVEPIAKRLVPWWPEWQTAWLAAGGRADEWRFPAALPPTQQTLARAAGLDPRELTARSLWLPARTREQGSGEPVV